MAKVLEPSFEINKIYVDRYRYRYRYRYMKSASKFQKKGFPF